MKLYIKKNEDGKKARFNALKLKIIRHLEELEEAEEKALKKALDAMFIMKGRGLPVGTIREWKGKKFIKLASGKWKPKYDSHTKGAKIAISHIKKKIIACKDEYEMMQVVLENRDRFSDKNGNPLPLVQELHEATNEAQREKDNINKKEEGKTQDIKSQDGYPEKDYPEYKGKGQENGMLRQNLACILLQA